MYTALSKASTMPFECLSNPATQRSHWVCTQSTVSSASRVHPSDEIATGSPTRLSTGRTNPNINRLAPLSSPHNDELNVHRPSAIVGDGGKSCTNRPKPSYCGNMPAACQTIGLAWACRRAAASSSACKCAPDCLSSLT